MKRNSDVVISSPVELTGEQKAKVETLIAEGFEKRGILVSYRVDPKLLGGLVIHIGSKVVDLSLDGKLQSIREYLIKHGSE